MMLIAQTSSSNDFSSYCICHAVVPLGLPQLEQLLRYADMARGLDADDKTPGAFSFVRVEFLYHGARYIGYCDVLDEILTNPEEAVRYAIPDVPDAYLFPDDFGIPEDVIEETECGSVIFYDNSLQFEASPRNSSDCETTVAIPYEVLEDLREKLVGEQEPHGKRLIQIEEELPGLAYRMEDLSGDGDCFSSTYVPWSAEITGWEEDDSGNPKGVTVTARVVSSWVCSDQTHTETHRLEELVPVREDGSLDLRSVDWLAEAPIP